MAEHSTWSESTDGDPERKERSQVARTTSTETAERPVKVIIQFGERDTDNPYNWSTIKKFLVLLSVTNAINNANLGSTLATGIQSFTTHFGVTNKIELTVPSSLYMFGYVVGPTIAGPLSEHYGRRHVLNGAFAFYTIFSLACIGAPNFAAFVTFRLFMGMGAAVPLSVIGGTCADMYSDTIRRGRALAFFISAAGFGPAIGPISSGYLANRGWNLPYWVGSAIAIVSLAILLITPETYGPAILRTKARKARKAGKTNVYADIELQETSVLSKVRELSIKAPKMFVTEPLVFCICVFMAFIYGVFYVFFQAYHKIYEDGYHMTPGQAGLTFLALGIGGIPGFGIQVWYDRHLRKLEKAGMLSGKHREEKLRLPLACIGAVMLVVALFWTGACASRPQTVHWSITVLALVPFGAGYMLIYASLCNYLVDSYAKFAASAMAAGTATRSLLAAGLPMISGIMYEKVGIQWGSYLLGFIMLALGTVPFVFLRYGNTIRERSAICRELQGEKEKESRDRDAATEPKKESV